MAPLVLSRLERWNPLFSARSQSSCRAFPASFGLLLRGAAERVYPGSLLRSIRRLLVTFDFCFGQFCSFSAQIGIGVNDFNSFNALQRVGKCFLALR
jgi:hypothetical protein